MNMRSGARCVAVLGPTNTGKTHYAIERMLAHRTGVIGLPLRLLAREVYDRIKAIRGPDCVALVTGEERIVPDRTQYWVCTVEAMPLEIGADFVAIDEIQLCADPDRGHVFTDRLLHARGLHETLFMGSDTMRQAIAALVPGVQFQRRERMSQLTYSGSKKISRMPPRSAIVGFSVENVYAIAELIRRQKGGCAVVMGALSPRTRNAQVELYQNGDVDYLVATDAIGMGLNLDIKHVAFSATVKFDGRRMRPLNPDELAQIAGRAGRYQSNGSFGVTGEARPLADEVIAAIENHEFLPVRKLHWRNARMDFTSPTRLIASLEAPTSNDWLTRARDADDVVALKTLTAQPDIIDRLRDGRDLRLLWDVCRIPDFRGISAMEHAGLLARVFGFLHDDGRIDADWLARNIARIDRTDGDIDTLSKRLAYIRTWTYIAQRAAWVDDENHWRGATRAVEDRLSDALHDRLTQRFVDRRTSVLLRRLKQKESLVAEVNDKGEVTVEGQLIGRLEGFRFRQDATATPEEARMLRQASVAALVPVFHLRADKFYNAADTEFDFTEQGGLMWGNTAVGKLIKGDDAMRPQVVAFVDDEAGHDVADKVRRRLQHFIDRKIAALFDPLLAMSRDDALTGMARGVAFQMVEAMGIIPREAIANDIKALDQDSRGMLRKHGVRFGQYTVFLPLLLKPAPTRLRLVLRSLADGLDEFPESPPAGLVTIPYLADIPVGHYLMSGYRPAGARAIRIDMLERLADLLRAKDSRAGFEGTADMLSITGTTLEQFADLMTGLGYAALRGERPKVKADVPLAPIATDGASADLDAPAPIDAVSDAPTAPVADKPEDVMEVFYTFTWAPRARGNTRPERRDDTRKPRADRAAPAVAVDGAVADAPRNPNRRDRPRRDAAPQDRTPRDQAPADKVAGDRAARDQAPRDQAPRDPRPRDTGPRSDRPREDRRDDRNKAGAKGNKGRKPDAPQTFVAAAPRKSDKIDMDNPFAAALMGLKLKG